MPWVHISNSGCCALRAGAQNEKRYYDQITRENGQIDDQSAQLIFFQHQTLNRRKDKKRRPNNQHSDNGALDAPSLIGLDKTKGLYLSGGPPSKSSVSARFASAIFHKLLLSIDYRH